MNRSRVFPARLIGRRAGGGKAEMLLVEATDSTQETWEALVRPGRKLPCGSEITVDDDLSVRIESGPLAPDGRRRLRLLTRAADAVTAIHRAGHVPLPPYIRRPDRPTDRDRYQTVYARETGSVAAPTAGLHFTPGLFQRLAARGIETTEVILHVGPATFRPVSVERVEQHRVSPESYVVPAAAAQAFRRTRERSGRIVAVGTTVVRTLESVVGPTGEIEASAGRTALVIVPGYQFRVVDGMVTNFHLPRSSLLLLVSAFAGRERILAAYGEAIRLKYRFYSYGDAMLIV